MSYNHDKKFHRDIGSLLNGLITLIIFGVVIKLLGDVAINKLVIAFIAAGISYPLVGLVLRGIGFWKY